MAEIVPGPTRPSAKANAAPRWLFDVREHFLAAPEEPLPASVRTVVADSWRRSLHLGVDPETSAPLELDEVALHAYREAHPLAALMPIVRCLLTEDADDAGHIVAVGDVQGRLLWVEGHRGLRSRAERMHFVEGALWSERGAGTNAPGTALALSAPVQISRGEHFGTDVQRWSCVAAPVRNPLDGTILGVIDLTGRTDVAGPRSLALVRACAAAMEAQLLVVARSQPGLAVPAYPGSVGTWAVPTADNRVSDGPTPDPPRAAATRALVRSGSRHPLGGPPATRPPGRGQGSLELLGLEAGVLHLPDHAVALSRRHAEIVWLLVRSGRGLTVQGLDAALHESGSHLVTIRSEMFRLRKLLGDEILGSRPYRLLLDVTSDVERLRGLLARGAVLKALDMFRGPPLLGSQAPAVVSARAELVAELRAAVLGSHSAVALERWTATDEGHDDDDAWQALAKALPYGSPKRATARAHLTRLATLLQPRRT
ncbi:MAG: GAF domain-containing protein [Dermatophilaceae bacterium]